MLYVYCLEAEIFEKIDLKIDFEKICNIEDIAKFFSPSKDRLVIVGERLHKINSEMMKKNGFVVIQYFSDIDWIETIANNGANTLTLDTLIHSFNLISWTIEKWFSLPEYEKDGFHDKYVASLRSW